MIEKRETTGEERIIFLLIISYIQIIIAISLNLLSWFPFIKRTGQNTSLQVFGLKNTFQNIFGTNSQYKIPL